MNSKKRLKIVETVLRDGHQSLAATRMRMSDMIPMLEQLDNAGFHALEAWGGATFDSCLRFLEENPWERLRVLKAHLKKTPIQMLLRGQNILGYKHYADDVVTEFVNRSVDNGVGIIRIFDALNDVRNLEVSMQAAKKAGAHVQGAVVYTISPYHTNENFLKIAKELVQLGADSICIKDMSGLLAPYAAYHLIKTFKAELTVPINLHTHYTSGMASMTYLKASEAGVDIIDCALSPFAMGTAQPATEALVAALEGTERDTGINKEQLYPIADYFRGVKKELAETFKLNTAMDIDTKVLSFQIPGGMLSNLLNQLKEQGAADKYPELLEEMPRVRAELGYPPLVTPTSQMVGSMAAFNVMVGRYKVVPKEIRDLVLGKYGRTPASIDPEIQKIIIGDEQPITHRPADDIPPQMDKLRQELAAKGYPKANMEDVLSYALFPEVALSYFAARSEHKTSADDMVGHF
jgi:oxaloacetate decarboxylase (Na+ extruding) subunit alpha